jgi:uncharacterized protein YecE (DUF72 family)
MDLFDRPSPSPVTTLHPGLRVGTSSYSCPDWLGPFYPPGTKGPALLERYAARYDTVEIDATFYRSPTPRQVRAWRAAVPPGFRFALKVPRTITHEKALAGCEAEGEAFAAAVSELGDRLGVVLLQFGYFNQTSACPTMEAFLDRLDAFLDRVPMPAPVAVEVRNPRWLGAALLQRLAARNVSLVLAEQEWMPAIADLWQQHGERLLTGPLAYVRLVGQRKRIDAMTRTVDRLVIDRADETRAVIAVLRAILATGRPAWVYVNNHYAGYAPGSIELLASLWPG